MTAREDSPRGRARENLDARMLRAEQAYAVLVTSFRDAVIDLAAHRMTFGTWPEGAAERVRAAKKSMIELQIALLRLRIERMELDLAEMDESPAGPPAGLEDLEIPDFLPDDL